MIYFLEFPSMFNLPLSLLHTDTHSHKTDLVFNVIHLILSRSNIRL